MQRFRLDKNLSFSFPQFHLVVPRELVLVLLHFHLIFLVVISLPTPFASEFRNIVFKESHIVIVAYRTRNIYHAIKLFRVKQKKFFYFWCKGYMYHLFTCLTATNTIVAYIAIKTINESDFFITEETISVTIRKVKDRLEAIRRI